MAKAKPLLTDVQADSTAYEAGDLVIVRLSRVVTPQQLENLRKSVVSFCGAEVSPLFVDCSATEIVRRVSMQDPSAEDVLLAGLDHFMLDPNENQLKLSCSKVVLTPGDVLEVYLKPRPTEAVRRCLGAIEEWARYEHEVIPMPWRFAL